MKLSQSTLFIGTLLIAGLLCFAPASRADETVTVCGITLPALNLDPNDGSRAPKIAGAAEYAIRNENEGAVVTSCEEGGTIFVVLAYPADDGMAADTSAIVFRGEQLKGAGYSVPPKRSPVPHALYCFAQYAWGGSDCGKYTMDAAYRLTRVEGAAPGACDNPRTRCRDDAGNLVNSTN